MSLKLWLPLNDGTPTNQGAADVEMTEYNPLWGATDYMGSNVFYNNTVTNFHYLVNPDTKEFNFGASDDFTICFFVYYTGTAFSGQGRSEVFSVGRSDYAAGGYGIGAYNNGGGTTFRYGSKIYALSHALNAWKHVAFVKKGNNIKVYQSGTLIINATFDGTYPTYTDNSGIGVGCFHYSGGNIYPLNGYIADFRIYDNAISPKEIRDIIRVTLVHYPMEGNETASGCTVSDCSGWGRNAVLSGTVVGDRRCGSYTTSAAAGTLMPRGLYFNSSGYIHNDSFNMKVPSFTLSFWGYFAKGTTGMQHFLFGTFTSWTNHGIGIWRDGANNYYNVLVKGDSANSYGTVSLPFTPSTFQFYTVVYDGSSIKTYVNGVLQNTASYSGGMVTNPVFYIFNSKYNGTPASENENGLIGDVRFMAGALTASDVLEMYKAPISVARSNTLYTFAEYKDDAVNYLGDSLDLTKIYSTGWFAGEKLLTEEGNLRLASYNGWQTYYWYNTNFTNKALIFEFEYRVVEYEHVVHNIHLVTTNNTSGLYGIDANLIVGSVQNDGQWHYAKVEFTGQGSYLGFCIRGTDNSGTYSRIEFRNIVATPATNGVHFLKNGVVQSHHLTEDDTNVQIMKSSRIKAEEFKEL